MVAGSRPVSSPQAAQEQTDDNALVPIALGTAGWLIAGVALVVAGNSVPEDSRWWIGTCAVGFGSGVCGLVYVRRRSGRPQRAALRAQRKLADQA